MWELLRGGGSMWELLRGVKENVWPGELNTIPRVW
jgi:hypothetical protein